MLKLTILIFVLKAFSSYSFNLFIATHLSLVKNIQNMNGSSIKLLTFKTYNPSFSSAIEQEAGYTLDRSLVCHRANT